MESMLKIQSIVDIKIENKIKRIKNTLNIDINCLIIKYQKVKKNYLVVVYIDFFNPYDSTIMKIVNIIK